MSRNLPIFCLVALLGACEGEPDQPSAVRTDSAGIEVVTSTGIDSELSWAVVPVFSVGGAEEGPEAFYRIGVGSVAADASGHVAVLDGPARRIIVFSRDGEVISVVGKPGKGPGEISMPVSLATGTDGSIYVLDFAKGALVHFSSTGEVLPEVPFHLSPVANPVRIFAVRPDGFLAYGIVTPLREGEFREALQLLTPADTIIIAEQSYPSRGMAMYPSCGGGLNLPPVFQAAVPWDTRDNRIIVAPGPEYSVDIVQDHHITRRIRRDLKSRPATHAAAVAELGDGFTINFGRGPCTIPAAEMASKRGFADFVPWIAQVSVSPGGEVWALRKEVGPEGARTIDVFDSTGVYRGSLPSGTPFPLGFIDNNRYVASQTDTLDVTRLVGYDITRR